MNWFPKKHVIVPIDFSETSFAALDTALQLVDDPAHLHVIHVLRSLSTMEPAVIWDDLTDEKRCLTAEKALQDRLSTDQYRGVNLAISVGDPGTKIVEYAQQKSADLIVIPSHVRKGLSRLLLGSVAERVIRLAHCPVLVLRD